MPGTPIALAQVTFARVWNPLHPPLVVVAHDSTWAPRKGWLLVVGYTWMDVMWG